MGMIATDAAEVVSRTQSDIAGGMTDLRTAGEVQVLADSTGKVWVNVDGVCLLRIEIVTELMIDTSLRGSDGVTIKAS